ncbi:hypothetical protein [Antrihabitans sp. YC2-6]|nr:hypothetical protein [Antrihabitans sp. YC2-6]MBJ8348136.1 hypothetical protein [Antrihabitans sp. YC2-6]
MALFVLLSIYAVVFAPLALPPVVGLFAAIVNLVRNSVRPAKHALA